MEKLLSNLTKIITAIVIGCAPFCLKMCDEVLTTAGKYGDIAPLVISKIPNIINAFEKLQSAKNSRDSVAIYQRGVKIALESDNYCDKFRKWHNKCLAYSKFNNKKLYNFLSSDLGEFLYDHLIEYHFFEKELFLPLLCDRHQSVDLPTIWKILGIANIGSWYDNVEKSIKKRDELVLYLSKEFSKSREHDEIRQEDIESSWDRYITDLLQELGEMGSSDVTNNHSEEYYSVKLNCIVQNSLAIRDRRSDNVHWVTIEDFFEAKKFCEANTFAKNCVSLKEFIKVKYTKKELNLLYFGD